MTMMQMTATAMQQPSFRLRAFAAAAAFALAPLLPRPTLDLDISGRRPPDPLVAMLPDAEPFDLRDALEGTRDALEGARDAAFDVALLLPLCAPVDTFDLADPLTPIEL